MATPTADVDDDSQPIFEPVTVFGGDELDPAIEKQIANINFGNQKWEISKCKLSNGKDSKVTVYFTDDQHISATFLWRKLSQCSKSYTGARIVVKSDTNKDSISDSKIKSRIEIFYGGVIPTKRVIDVKKNSDIVIEYDKCFPTSMQTSREAGGLELLASAMENNLKTIECVDAEGNHTKRKYEILPPSAVTKRPGPGFIIHVSNLTNEFYYETLREMMKALTPRLQVDHGLAADYWLFVLDSSLYLCVRPLVEPTPTPSGRGHGMKRTGGVV